MRCPGQLVLFKESVVRVTGHSHIPDYGKVRATEFLSHLKTTAIENPDLKPDEVYSRTARRFPASEEMAARLPEKESLKRKIRQARPIPWSTAPQKFQDIRIPDE